MAQHSSLEEMASAAIDEYFQAVAYCLSFRTADGGCLGFPAALLLFCITDALGNWLRDEAGNPTVGETRLRDRLRRVGGEHGGRCPAETRWVSIGPY